MKKFICALLLLQVCFSAFAQHTDDNRPWRQRRRSPIDSPVFRGNWWDYYNRAVRRILKGDLTGAESDLRKAIELRPEDDPHARTFGVRFQEYYPRAELGVLLYDQGHYREALLQLQQSYKQAPLEQTLFFLHESRKQVVRADGSDRSPPQIVITQPLPGLVTHQNQFLLRGIARDDTYIDQISVGNQPLDIKKAQNTIEFRHEILLPERNNEVRVTVVDIAGRETSLPLEIEVDREGPAFSLEKIDLDSGGNHAILTGIVFDRHSIARIEAGSRTLTVQGRDRERLENLRVPLSRDGKVYLNLTDGFGNNTVLVLDPRMKVGAAPSVSPKVRVASVGFNPAWLMGATEDKPKIDLGDLTDGLEFSQDTIAVDILTTDKAGIQEVLCNGESLDLADPGGKTQSLSYFWGPLSDGTNTLEIQVTNISNQIRTESLEIRYTPPHTWSDHTLRVRLAPVRVFPEGSSDSSTHTSQDFLERNLRKRGRFDLFPSELSTELIASQERSLSGTRIVDERFQAPVSSLQRADYIFQLTVEILRSTVIADVVITDVRRGVTLNENITAESPTKTREDIETMVRALSLKLEEIFPRVVGRILETSPPYVVSDLSEKAQVRVHYQAVAYHPTQDSYNGRSYQGGWIPLGPMIFSHVGRDTSTLREEGTMTKRPRIGDAVATR